MVVEDSAKCKRTLIPPDGSLPGIPVQTAEGIALHSGSDTDKIDLSGLQKVFSTDPVFGIVAQDEDGNLLNSLPPNDAKSYLPVGLGTSFTWTEINGIYGAGTGVLGKLTIPTDSPIQYFLGTQGQVLSLDADLNPEFVDPSSLTGRAGFIDAQSINAAYSSGASIIVGFGQLVVVDGSDSIIITNSASKVLNLSLTGAGGLDAGSLAASTYYWIYAIYNKTTDTINVLGSTSPTTPLLPTDYNHFRLIGMFRTTAASLVSTGYVQTGRMCFLGETASPVPFSQGPTATTTMYTGAITGLPPYQYVNQAMFRMDAIGVTSTYECNVIIADQIAGATGASVSLPATSNQYGSGNFTSTRTGLNAYATFTAIIPYATAIYYNIYYAAAIPSGDSAALRMIGFQLSIF